MKVVGYYPGCSLSGGGIELDLSIRALAKVAEVELREIEDWNCCGSTAAHNLNHELSVALPYRVLALAEEQGLKEVLAPCAACFSRLKGTNVRLSRSKKLAQEMQDIVAKPYGGGVRILNLNEFLNSLLADGLAQKLTRPLKGLKVAPYYGCLLSRGEGIIEGDNPEAPASMEPALTAAGCQIVPWNFATECCGGGFSMSKTHAVLDLSNAILADAKAAGADAIVAACPMCHSNLDMRQRNINSAGLGEYDMPVLYLSEVLGLAAGLEPKALGLDRHFVDAMRLTTRQPADAAAPAS
jgi:heterodisulfide reductase subunit B